MFMRHTYFKSHITGKYVRSIHTYIYVFIVDLEMATSLLFMLTQILNKYILYYHNAFLVTKQGHFKMGHQHVQQ